ncbi:MAG: SDR family NAD(P)-dependent oxidoreductase, partial [Deltaproteobacteria bacterium]
VAGASRGIGRNIACELAHQGAAVAVAARSTTEGKLAGTIHSVAAMISSEGGRALAVPCDVTDERSVETAVAATVAEFGGIDILVANAGVMWLAPTLETTLARWELCLRVNLTGVFLVTRAVLPHVKANSGGSLIAVTTTGVAMTELGSNAYWTSKAGVERYYTGLANELRDDNIAVNCLAPKKVVRTEGMAVAARDLDIPDDMFEADEAMGRAAVILAQQDATGMTGTVQYSLDLLEAEAGD